MLAVPVVEAEKVTWHDAVPSVPATRVHGLPVKVPVTPVWVNVTVPVGVRAVPAVEVSVTVAVHVVETPTATVCGEQETVVVVVLGLTTTLVVPLDAL